MGVEGRERLAGAAAAARVYVGRREQAGRQEQARAGKRERRL